jgi:2-keto-4-pentenoate hydratase/2-oxohepta-3-ene-1,7-dioic acid hydratase in catechol pathway
MKLVSFGPKGKERPGVMRGDDVVIDLEIATNGKITSINALLNEGETGLSLVRETIEKELPEAALKSAVEVRFGPPITQPSKIVCVGLNYHCHANEQGAKLPKKPMLFNKATLSLSGHGDPIMYPVDEEHLDYEAELAFVFGKKAFRVPAEDWESYVAGYTVVNDVSARDAQFGDRQWWRGKSCDSFAPCGPFVVTVDEVGDPHNLKIECKRNDSIQQSSNTSQLIFNSYQLIEFITQTITLEPGDIILTGTPSGVGVFRDPPVFLKAGDLVEITIEKLGTLRNPVVAEL